MDTTNSVPSLGALIKRGCWDNQCCWHNQSKSSKNPKRCGNAIRGRDAMERNSLIIGLRALIQSAENTATLTPVIPESIPEIHELFGKVSMWLLCKGKHRSEFEKIVQKWSDELDDVERERDLPAVVDTSKELRDPPAIIDIRKELNIQDGEKIFCHGKKGNGTNCTKPISAQNHDCASAMITALGQARDYSPAIEESTLVLAHLLMCQANHQQQAPEKSEEWIEKIRKLLTPSDATSEPPSTLPPSTLPPATLPPSTLPPLTLPPSTLPPSTPQQRSIPTYSRTVTVDSDRSKSTASSVFSSADSISTSTPSTSPPSRRRYGRGVIASPSPLLSRRATPATTIDNGESQSVVGTRTRGYSTVVLPIDSTILKFKPFPPKSLKAVMAKIYASINRPIIPREEDTGYIYGFHRDGDSLVKFGYTNKLGIKSRIKAWNSGCKQQVRVVVQEYLPHAAKVESLVHAILYRERRRELLINGACNGGKGCSTVHEEWFDVSLDRLLDIVERCKRWIRTWPYENGKLKPVWVEHIDKLYKAWVNTINKLSKAPSTPFLDDWHAWMDITTLAVGTIIQETVPCDVKEKTGITITTTEFKNELDGCVASDTEERRQGLSAISRGYNESIIHIKAEVTEEKPLMEVPAVLPDLSLQLQDPFLASTVIKVPA